MYFGDWGPITLGQPHDKQRAENKCFLDCDFAINNSHALLKRIGEAKKRRRRSETKSICLDARWKTLID